MKIFEAKRRVRRMRVIAVPLMVGALLVVACSALKTAYITMGGDTSLFSGVSHAIKTIIYFIYEKTQFVSWVWEAAPIIDMRNINTSGNFGLFFVVCCVAVGRVMWDSASDLSSRISRTIRKVEEIGWEQSLLAQQGLAKGEKPDVLQINIDLNQKDQWYKRPVGLIVVGVAIAVLAQWANLKFGLIK